MDVRRVAVAGTGMMGPGIAATYALAGKEAVIVSRTAEGAAKGVATAQGLIATLAANGLADPAQAKAAQGRFSTSCDPEGAARSVQLFVESIAENLAVKQEYFARLDAAAPDTILCSNTSGISITEIAARCTRPERIVTTHFWNPPYIMPLVEVIVGKRTDLAIAEGVVALLRACGKVPVLVRKDVPGQLGNRIQHAMVRECMHIVAEGIASAEDVDLAVKAGVGLRFPVYGVFEHADLVGLELVKAVQDYVIPDLGKAQGAAPVHNEKIAKGETGAKAGKGFLDWPAGKAEQVRARRDAFLMEFLRLQRAGKFD
jgi:3-hydroxybutyryl-CoA dehydrogenase